MRRGHGLVLPTRRARPDPHARLGALRPRSREQLPQPGAPALAAVDGSPATDWQPTTVHATLTAARGAAGRPDPHDHAAVGTPVARRAGAQRAASARAGHRAAAEQLHGPGVEQRAHVADGGELHGRSGVLDTVHLHAVKARFVRIRDDRSRRDQAPAARRAHRANGQL